MAATDAGAQAQAGIFVDALARFGIQSSRVDVEDFDLFAHAGIADAIEQFILAAPGAPLPLERITVNRYASRDRCDEDLRATLELLAASREGLTRFAKRYNVEIHLNTFVQNLAPEPAIATARIAAGDIVDSVGFYFDPTAIDGPSLATLKAALATLCDSPAMRNPRVKLGNFPFCFLPPSRFRYLYREPLDALKGQIAPQRSLLRELQSQFVLRHDPCYRCRRRAPCYAFTRIGESPACAPFLEPCHERTVAFAGGSLPPAERPADPDIVWAGPAEQGDMLAAALEGFDNLLIVDGYFYDRFPCTTFEVMLAIEAGMNVFGSSSMGALRAVELDADGMTGIGRVYERLRKEPIRPYHVVAQTYDERDRPLTEPLVHVEFFLECAEAEGVIGAGERQALRAVAENIHFTALTFDEFFAAAPSERLAAYYRAQGAERFNIKKADALQLLREFRSIVAGRQHSHARHALVSSFNRRIAALREAYPARADLTLPAAWQASRANSPGREATAGETCERAGAFLRQFDIAVADTSRYDRADSHILSAFFLPFYFLDYSPSSATGNGPVFQEALASACMELLERISASTAAIAGVGEEALPEPPVPAARIPQLYNWGCDDRTKSDAVARHGYVAVSDVLRGKPAFIPGMACLFQYSGTDGCAAGNTPAEAVLYGIYEAVERDTCQLHLLDPACRQALPHLRVDRALVTDPRSLALMDQADAKGCDMILFHLPNLSGLPCVMCHVYDRNRRIQCHGGIAVRSDMRAAIHSALHEAYMQYITYFVGTRDDYRALAPTKQARIAFENAGKLFGRPGEGWAALPGPARFQSVGEELGHVLDRLRAGGTESVLVADIGPNNTPGLHCVKVIVPGFELWFCPQYTPSPYFAERAAKTAALLPHHS